jgi:hypothetical protein
MRTKNKARVRETVCTGGDFAKALSKTALSKGEAAAWCRDLKAGRKTLKSPVDKWR